MTLLPNNQSYERKKREIILQKNILRTLNFFKFSYVLCYVEDSIAGGIYCRIGRMGLNGDISYADAYQLTTS